ncbi:TerB family tellurite resistance protein [Maribacter sp. X9]|uniref:TerB family tellurite resistance protein n=1 Tax=Maribacter sp. X9 TaxID=3402159 RepID=UPI003AF3DDC5
MNFEISEKLAIVNLVDSVIMADGEVHEGEINAFSELMEVIDFDTNFLLQARNLNTENSIGLLKDMSNEKKNRLVKILEDIAISDGFVHEKELEVIKHVISSIGTN